VFHACMNASMHEWDVCHGITKARISFKNVANFTPSKEFKIHLCLHVEIFLMFARHKRKYARLSLCFCLHRTGRVHDVSVRRTYKCKNYHHTHAMREKSSTCKNKKGMHADC
jgi:hypothetical protein